MLAQHPLVDVAQGRLHEHTAPGIAQLIEFVESQQHTDNGGRHVILARGDKILVGGHHVVRTTTGQRAGDADVGVLLGQQLHDGHCRLSTLRIAYVQQFVLVPLEALLLQQLAGSYQGVDRCPCIVASQTVGLVLIGGRAKAIVIGRDHDESATGQQILQYHVLQEQVSLRWALRGLIHRIVVVEHDTASHHVR